MCFVVGFAHRVENRILQKSYDDLLAYSSFFQDNKLMNLLGIGNSSFELAHILKNDHTAYKNFQLIEYSPFQKCTSIYLKFPIQYIS